MKRTEQRQEARGGGGEEVGRMDGPTKGRVSLHKKEGLFIWDAPPSLHLFGILLLVTHSEPSQYYHQW